MRISIAVVGEMAQGDGPVTGAVQVQYKYEQKSKYKSDVSII